MISLYSYFIYKFYFFLVQMFLVSPKFVFFPKFVYEFMKSIHIQIHLRKEPCCSCRDHLQKQQLANKGRFSHPFEAMLVLTFHLSLRAVAPSQLQLC